MGGAGVNNTPTNLVSPQPDDLIFVIEAVMEVHNVEVVLSLNDPRVTLLILPSGDAEYHMKEVTVVGGLIQHWFQCAQGVIVQVSTGEQFGCFY